MAKILVVDDEESITYTFRTFLTDKGHDVFVAASYDGAVKLLSENGVDVVVSDIVLGGRTGIDVLRAVKQRGLLCPVVIITGYPEVHTAAEAVRLGAFDYVPKPVVQETLLHLTEAALERKKVIDERIRCRAHLEAVFSSLGDALITVDRSLSILELNDAAQTIFGLSRSVIGKNLADVGLPHREELVRTVEETLETGRALAGLRLECRGTSAYPLVLSVASYPLASREGGLGGAVVVVRNESPQTSCRRAAGLRERFHTIIGASEPMQEVYSLIESLATVGTTVLITGESGTGKELIADALHHCGLRSGRPLVKVNCSALAEGLLESEIFGHVKGAFTGAVSDRVGRFQNADGGTIFLDEIGDVSPKVQASLLRVLQHKEIERLGESRTIRMDVRVIAATNADLREKIMQGRFREDLYYRLKVVEIPVPPLRERRKDIPLLVRHFMSALNGKLNKNVKAVTSDVEKVFMQYPWPGNVRELENALEHAVVVCRHDTISREDLPLHFRDWTREEPAASLLPGSEEAEVIRTILKQTAGNKARAARLLGIDRKTLYRKIERYSLEDDPLSNL